MGKIEKKATEKHEATLSPAIADFIKTTVAIPLFQLPSHLESFPKRWPFPRGDVYHWIDALNRFDSILEQFITSYGLGEGPQTQEFGRTLLLSGDKQADAVNAREGTSDDALSALGYSPEGDRELIESIIRFSKLVIENCGNRSMYASTNRLNDLLNTTSLSLVDITLRMTLRCAQRYSAARLRTGVQYLPSIQQGTLSTHYRIDLDRVEKLAQPFVTVSSDSAQASSVDRKNEDGNSNNQPDLLTMVRDDIDVQVDWQRYADLQMDIREQGAKLGTKFVLEQPTPNSRVPATPTPARWSNLGKSSENLEQEDMDEDKVQGVLRISNSDLSSKPLTHVLQQHLAEVPSDLRYDFLQKLRVAQSLPASLGARRAITRIRMLAIANLANIYPESQLDSKVLSHDVEAPRRFQLPHQLSDLLHPPGKATNAVSKDIQAVALETLEAFCLHKNKSTDVTTALGATVSHGTFTFIVRKALNEPTSEEDALEELEDRDWRRSLAALLHALPRAMPRYGEGLVQSGFMEIVVKAMSRRSQKAEEDHASVLTFVDVYTYNTEPAFNAFVNAKGLDEVAGLLDHEVNLAISSVEAGNGMPRDYKTSMTDYQIPFNQQQTLRALVKFLGHIMGFSGGATDRLLRNLIESSQLLNGIRTIISQPSLFGTNVWSGAVNVFSSFIHNEPTSYAAIAEAGLVRTFIETIAQKALDQSTTISVDTAQQQLGGILVDIDNFGNVVMKGTANRYGSASDMQKGVLASIEAIAAIPQALSAICLNEAGMQQLHSSNVLAKFFRVFLSPVHVKSLSSSDLTQGIEGLGKDLEELARHHPDLKPEIIKLVAATSHDLALVVNGVHQLRNHSPRLCHLDQQGRTVCDEGYPVELLTFPQNDHMAILIGDSHWAITLSTGEDVEMADITTPTSKVDMKHYLASPTAADYVSVFSRFLHGFFPNNTHAALLGEYGGIDHILNIAFSHSLPMSIYSPITSNNKMVRVVQSLVEAKPHLVLPFVLDRMQAALNELEPFISHEQGTSFFESFLKLQNSGQAASDSQQHFTGALKALQTAQMGCSILSRCLSAPVGRSSVSPLSAVNLMDMYASIVTTLGRLQIRCDFDRFHADLYYKKNQSVKDAPTIVEDQSALAASPPLPMTSSEHVPASSSESTIPTRSLEEFNYRQIRYLSQETSMNIQKLFGNLSKALLSRRLPGSDYAKQNMLMVAEAIAQALADQYTVFENLQDKATHGALVAATERLMPTFVDNRFDIDRKSPEIYTLILRAFKDKGGLVSLGCLAQDLKNFYVTLSEHDDQKTTTAKVLTDILTFFGTITDHNVVSASIQTKHLESRSERDTAHALQSSQFLVEMRMQVLNAVEPIWNASDIENLPGKVLKALSLILKEILDANHEHSAYKRGHHIPRKPESAKRTWIVNQAHVDRLTERDYAPDMGREALYRCNDNHANALEYCAAYKRNPSLPRHAIPPYDTITTTPAEGSAQVDSQSNTPSNRPTGTEQLLASIPLADLQGPLGEMAQDIFARTVGANPISPQQPSAPLSLSPVQSLNTERSDVITVDDLSDARNRIRSELVDRCIAILNAFDNVTFEMADIIMAGVNNAQDPSALRQDITTTLIQSLISFLGVEDLTENAQKIARSAHLFGIIISKDKFFEAAMEELQSNFSTLMEFLAVPQAQQSQSLDSAPWIARILLVLEALLAEDTHPKQIAWQPPHGDEIPEVSPLASLPEPLVSKEDKASLLTRIVELLPRVGKDTDLGSAFCRTLVLLTRDRQLAQKLGKKSNMQRFFSMLKQLSIGMDNNFRGSVMIVLRHIVEDEATVRQIMRTEIKAMFDKPGPRIDTTMYTQTASHLVLRAPELFVEVTNELLELQRYERNQGPQYLSLKKQESVTKDEPAAADNQAVQPAATIEVPADFVKKVNDVLKTPSIEHPDGVVQYLLSELMAYKEVDDKEVKSGADSSGADVIGVTEVVDPVHDVDMADDSGSTSSAEPRSQEKKLDTKPEFKTEEHPIYVYRCFILQCLTELLGNYSRCKVEFINFSRKGDAQSATPSKPRSGVLNYLLTTLLPTGSVQHPEDIASKKKSCVSSWAISVVVALCAKTSEKNRKRSEVDENDEPDLVFVRRFVLEHALKVYKDANASSEAFEVKGSRLLAMADLFDRMLAARPVAPPGYGRREADQANLVPSQKAIAKLMYEKNFIGAFTSSVSDIDLTVPGAKRVVKYVLRPLRLLTHTAIELSVSSDSSSSAPPTDEDDISSATSVSEVGDEREDTPDFYRNSTLGMFDPNREDDEDSESEDEDDEEDEEMYGEEYADDMEYDEEQPDNDDVVSEEDEEMDGMGPVEGMPGDVPMHVEIDIDDGEGDEMDDDMDEDDEDDDDEEDDEDGGMDDEDDDAHIEILEELEEDLAEAEEDGWEDEGEEDEHGPGLHLSHGMGFSVGPGDAEEVIEMLGGADDADEDESENELGPFGSHGGILDQRADNVDLEVEDEQVIDETDGDDGDEDEGDYDDEEGYMEGGFGDFEMDDDDAGFLPSMVSGFLGGPGRPSRHSHQFFRTPPAFITGGYRSHRPTGPSRAVDAGQNPLLDRHRQADEPSRAASDAQHRASASLRGVLEMALPTGLPVPQGLNMEAILQSLSSMTSGTNSSARGINHLLQVVRDGGPVVHHHHHHHGADGHVHQTIAVMPPLPSSHEMFSSSRQGFSGRTSRNDPVSAVDFEPSETIGRWREEATIICNGPGRASAKAALVINAILRLLVPPAMRADKARKEALETARKEEEERQRLQAQKEEQERKEREEAEAAAKAAREAEEAARREQEAAQAAQNNAASDAMEGVETQSEMQTAAETTSEPARRVVTTIRGRELDITHLGIDLEFLDALPDEMREEVIMQQVAEQRSQAAASGQDISTINQDFLNALPAEIREELLQQEAADRRRREREENRRRASAAANGGQAQAEEMDAASFIAALDDPILRQSVLAEADDDFLAALPPDMRAEARALGGHHRRRGMGASGLLASMGLDPQGSGLNRPDRGAENRNAASRPRRPIMQMIDKSGVATLLRLMFVKMQGSSRHSLNEILRNACGNHQTRGEIISGLLSVIRDGTYDTAAVERAYSSIMTKATQPASVTKTPQSTKRAPVKPAIDPSESSPTLVMDHCLHALIFLSSHIPHIPRFFLTEHEALASAVSKPRSKGKGKDNRAGRYPINSLLTLLERDTVIDSPSLIEHLASLLQMLTSPLNTLLKKEKPDTASTADPEASSAQIASASAPTTTPSDTPAGNAAALDDNRANAQQSAEGPTTENGANAEAKVDDKKKDFVAPEIPEKYLRSIVNVLTARECSGKTFRDTLSTITNLSAIPGARQIFGQELVGRARQLASTIQTDLQQLIQSLRGAEDEMEAQSLALANFSPAGSDQAKLNRVLTALDYLYEKQIEEGAALLPGLYEDPSFNALWQQLSACLSATQQSERYFLNVATIMLPLIESLMVVCKGLTLKETRSELGSAPTTPAPQPAMKSVFFTFTNRHKKILNDLVRQNPKLMSGSFAVLIKNPGVLEFDNKRNYFTRKLHHRTTEQRSIPHAALQLNVRRDQVFNDSYRSLFFKKPEEIKYGKLNIRFHGEEGVDAGGVTREWFQVLARQMFNADNALFNPVASDRTTFHPNPLSSINDEHLKYFHFIGRMIGKALYENRVLDCHFSRAVYKRILGKAVTLKDLETIDLEYTKSLRWMLENDITDIITETFSVEKDNFGLVETIDLIDNGRNIAVTEQNKQEYVRLVMEYRLTGSVEEQLQHFLEGFHDIVPAELISIFDEGELELLISGMPEIDVDDWKNNTDYVSYNVSSPQIQWFWRAVRSFDKEERAKLLQFVTGTGKVPLNGFKELEGMNGFTRFSIHKDYGEKERLPSSHTCFNQLDLPEYEDYEKLRKSLYTAMTTGGEYFGFA